MIQCHRQQVVYTCADQVHGVFIWHCCCRQLDRDPTQTCSIQVRLELHSVACVITSLVTQGDAYANLATPALVGNLSRDKITDLITAQTAQRSSQHAQGCWFEQTKIDKGSTADAAQTCGVHEATVHAVVSQRGMAWQQHAIPQSSWQPKS